jgi:hypothetical protein
MVGRVAFFTIVSAYQPTLLKLQHIHTQSFWMIESDALRCFTGGLESRLPVRKSLPSATEYRRVKRWQAEMMILRWTAAGVLEAERHFRTVAGYRALPKLRRCALKMPPSDARLKTENEPLK